MRFLASLFWICALLVAVLFARNNWQPVTIRLWGDQLVDSWLPVLLGLSFLIGLIPYFILHRASRWSLNRKLASTQRELEAARVPVAPAPAAPAPQPEPPEPTLGAPIAVPPGVS
jgi:hypothetical protein